MQTLFQELASHTRGPVTRTNDPWGHIVTVPIARTRTLRLRDFQRPDCVWLPSARAGPGTQACVIPALSRAAMGGGNGPSKRTGRRCGPAAGPDTASCVGGLSAGLKTARREVALGALSRARTSQRKRGEAKAEPRGRPGPLPKLLARLPAEVPTAALLPPGPGRGRTCPAPAPGIRAGAERQSAHPTSDLNAPPAQWGLFDFIN